MAEVGGSYVSNVIYPSQQPLLDDNSTPEDLTNGNGITFDSSAANDCIIIVSFSSIANLGSITISGNTNLFQVQLLDANNQPIIQQNNVQTISSTQGTSPTIDNFGAAGTAVSGVKIILISTDDQGYRF